MKILSRRAQGREGSNFVNDELRGALSKLLDHVENAPPLHINVASGRTFFLFTDGSYEPSSDVAAGIGGILYDDTACRYLSLVARCTQTTWMQCLRLRHIPFMR